MNILETRKRTETEKYRKKLNRKPFWEKGVAQCFMNILDTRKKNTENQYTIDALAQSTQSDNNTT